ncbi:hypothetical protein [Corallococcus sp. EGB]|uniref:hypothetical protein n=1 Tax=Corallococcus sp. EGB TaxID=1521117 RepID=UPI001CBD3DAC|nr:hypothetical protein [Corallococcus sp. EGB]
MSERRFPFLVTQKDLDNRGPRTIPWSLAERAYAEYSRRFGTSQSLDVLASRGGFSIYEMDLFVPGWRRELGL